MIYHNNIKFPLILKKLKKLTEPYCTPSPRKETVLFKFPLKNKVADFENIPTEDPLKPKTTVAVAPGRIT